jgi:hypothetical protein
MITEFLGVLAQFYVPGLPVLQFFMGKKHFQHQNQQEVLK